MLFGLVFGMLGRRLISRLSLSELAVNSVVSVSGLAGIALGAWVLRSKGISVERIAKRSVLIFVLTSAVNVVAVVVIGVPMWLGLLPGSRNPLLTLLPAAAALATIVGTSRARRLGSAARQSAAGSSSGRAAVALRALSGGVFDALGLIREHDWRLLGRGRLLAFDNLVLYACLAAFGHAPSLWAVAMAYLVGMLANAVPVPGGFVAVEGGLVGMLLLFGVRPAYQVLAAVVIYRAISLWVPALIGSLAFLSLRREIGKAARAAPRRLARGLFRQRGRECRRGGRPLAGVTGQRVHDLRHLRVQRPRQTGAVDRPRQAPGGRAGRVQRKQPLGCLQRVCERVREDVDRDPPRVELDRAAFVVYRRGDPAHDDVALRTERGVLVQRGR